MFPSIPGVTLDLTDKSKGKHKEEFFEELIRERCVYNQLPGKFKSLWFRYMERYLEKCFSSDTVNFK